ncbi:MAG TPA: immunoglobulin domain-containing protein, partial [Opitutaceae bacterium]|nr:immunoglobulin domain-containing protein [Opitutaceae bacterium]
MNTPPQNRTVGVGQSTTFAVVVSGTSTTINYQWQRRPAGGAFSSLANGGNYSGVLTATLTVTNASVAMNGDEFRCVISSGGFPDVTSPAATLTVTSAPVALPNLVPYVPSGWSGSLIAKTAAGAHTDAVTIFDDQEIFIDWSYHNSSTVDINTRTDHRLLVDGTARNTWFVASLFADWYYYWADYSIGRLSAGTHTLRMEFDYLQALGESNEGDNVITKTITVIARNAAPSITVQPQSQTAAAGQTVTFAIGATGNPATFTYTWQRMPAGSSVWSNVSNGGNYSGANTATLTVTGLTAAMTNDQFRCIAANGVSPAATSSAATLTVATITQATAINNFASRAAIAGSSATITASNVGATKEVGEPNHAGANGGASVWWTWVAPTAGVVTISTNGSSFDTVLAVYTGTTLTGLVQVAADDDGGGGIASSVTFTAAAGTAYQIAIDG